MAGQNEYQDLLYAYSLGCLDGEDLKKLQEHFDSGDDYSWQELGEFQNLTALLPSILEIEIPGPDLKDKVARKLYRLRGEKKPKRTTKDSPAGGYMRPEQIEPEEEAAEIKGAVEDEPKEEEEQQQISQKSFRSSQRPSQATQIRERGLDIPSGEPEIEEEIIEEAETPSARIKSRTVKKEYTQKRSSSSGIIVGFLILVLFIAAAIYTYTKVDARLKAYQAEVDNLSQKIIELSAQNTGNKDLENLFMSKDAGIANLIPPKGGGTMQAKLIFNTGGGKSLLRVWNLPNLSGKAYQLWTNVSGELSSISIFNPAGSSADYWVNMPDVSGKKNVKFFITAEPDGGSKKPGNDLILIGGLQ